MSSRNRFLRTCASTAVLAAAFAGAAVAAHAADPTTPDQAASQGTISQVGEVVVVSRKRSENLQRVPIAVTSISSNQLAQEGIRETTDLQKVVPSLTVAYTPINANTSTANAAVFSLRGQTAGDVLLTLSEPVGVYEDAANVPHTDGLNGSMFDLDHVEVLKGPQGTLYGRNTTGGAVNIITKGADYNGYHGFVSGEYGNYNDWKIGGAVNLPIVDDVLAARVAYQHWNRQGVGNDPTTGQHPGFDHNDDIIRLSLRFDPTSFFTSSTKLEFVNMNQVGYLQTLVALPLAGSPAAFEAGTELGCGTTPLQIATCGTAALDKWIGNPFQVGSEAHLSDKVQTWHFVEDWTWSLPYNTKLRSITGFHSVSDFPTTDLDGTPYQILEIFAGVNGPQPIAGGPYLHAQYPEDKYSSETQEINLSGSFLDNHVRWLVGGFGSWEHGYGGEPYIPFGALQGGLVSTTTQSSGENTSTWAFFTQEDFQLTSQLSLTMGGRYTHEQISNASQQYFWLNGSYTCNTTSATNTNPSPAPNNNPYSCYTINQNERSNGISYLFSLNYQITPDILAYAKTSRGFRGGALQFRAAGFPPVKPETAVDYEVGLKGEFLDHHLRTNIDYYHTNYSNKQEDAITTVCGYAIVPSSLLTCPAPYQALQPHSTTVLENAATAKVDGFEGEVTAIPVKGWSIYGTLTWLQGIYLKFPSAVNPDGNPVPNAAGAPFQDPDWRYSIGSRYEHEVGPGVLGGSIDWSWREHTNMSGINLTPSFSIPLQYQLNASVGLMDARIDYRIPDQGLTVALWATNLLNKTYQTESLFSAALGIATASTAPPRFFGFTVTKTFGPG